MICFVQYLAHGGLIIVSQGEKRLCRTADVAKVLQEGIIPATLKRNEDDMNDRVFFCLFALKPELWFYSKE